MKCSGSLCLVAFLLLVLAGACSLPPDAPITRDELMRTRIYKLYVIDESPEQVLNVLNTQGEAILEARKNVQGKNQPVYLKLLATADGLQVADYER